MHSSFCTSALFTDFYELTMAQGYWKRGMNDTVVFDMFFRKQPFSGGFSVFAGIEPLLDYLEEFSFDTEDIAFLRDQGIFEEGFLDFLKTFKFSGDLYAFAEGSIIFPQETLIRVHANLIEAQVIEGMLLNVCNFQSLIATKTARVWLASRKGNVMEFGLRRAQGQDGAMSATRASYIGGASGTSNALGAKKYCIKAMGTMAHSWVMSFPSEREAFDAYAEIYPDNSVFLIDTYDTLGSGIKNAIEAGKKLVAQGKSFGVRLDSGDISYLSKEVRRELDEAGFPNAGICVSNDLTEQIVETLVQQKAPITSWGVGTHMVTGGNESSFTGVYKLAAKRAGDAFTPVMKFSDNPTKNTNPGIKNVFRLFDENGMAKADILALEDETIEVGQERRYFHTMADYRQFSFAATRVEPMLEKRLEGGKRTTPRLSDAEQLQVSRQRMMSQIELFDPSFKRILNPHIYKVSMTQKLKDLKLSFIRANVEPRFSKKPL